MRSNGREIIEKQTIVSAEKPKIGESFEKHFKNSMKMSNSRKIINYKEKLGGFERTHA